MKWQKIFLSLFFVFFSLSLYADIYLSNADQEALQIELNNLNQLQANYEARTKDYEEQLRNYQASNNSLTDISYKMGRSIADLNSSIANRDMTIKNLENQLSELKKSSIKEKIEYGTGGAVVGGLIVFILMLIFGGK